MKNMKFEQAKDLLREGERVKRWTWQPEVYLTWPNPPNVPILIHYPNKEPYQWQPSQFDIINEDWEFVQK